MHRRLVVDLSRCCYTRTTAASVHLASRSSSAAVAHSIRTPSFFFSAPALPSFLSHTFVRTMSSEASSSSAPRRGGRGGKFAKRNAKRKARRDGEEVDEWQPKKLTKPSADDPSDEALFTQGGRVKRDANGFMESIPECPKFVDYYKAQGIIGENEWPAFLEALRTKLPTTFRLSTVGGMHYELLYKLKNEMQCTPEENAAGGEQSYTSLDPHTGKATTIAPPTTLPWYPDSLGWYIKAGKTELKTKGNKFEQFRKFLIAQNEQGNLNRQEAVSMIPPLLLDVKPHHTVLDMCAAPGSKTAQLLEGLHGGTQTTGDSFQTPSGMVIANDADYKRAYLLVHQLKRYGSSAFLVTTHDGQQFPNLYQKDPTVTTSTGAAKMEVDTPAAAASSIPAAASSSSSSDAPSVHPNSTLVGHSLVQFDRILCDVPCSGDGTLRKNMTLWNIWDTKFANGLHTLQLMISCRALEMLKIGGFMVYSTCSFNPIENESVVAELLRRCGGALELVDVSDKLPGLIRRPGMTTWKVRDTGADAWASPSDPTIVDGTHKILRSSMFPPSEEEVKKWNLQRCMRIIPQSQDTGGFFICLLKKTGETPNLKAGGVLAKQKPATASSTSATTAEASPEPVATEEIALAESVLAELPDLDGDGGAALPPGLDDPAGSNSHKKAVKESKKGEKKSTMFNEDPFEPLATETVQKILDFYGLAHDGVDHSNFFTRSEVTRKAYFVAPAIARILHAPRNAHKLKIVHTGSRCYERGTKEEDAQFPCQFRIVQEGVEAILPFMTKQLMYPEFKASMKLLYKHLWAYKDMRTDTESGGAEMYKEVLQHKNGCIVIVIKGSEIAKYSPTYAQQQAAAASSSSSSEVVPYQRRSIPLCVWKTPHSLGLMISPVEQAALIGLLDPLGTSMPPEVREKKEKEERERKEKEEIRKAKQIAHAAKTTTPAATATAASAPVAAPAASETAAKEEEKEAVKMQE